MIDQCKYFLTCGIGPETTNSKADSAFYPSEVNQIITKISWGFSGRKETVS